jgi:sn-glycerol 3-phosphate transport system permease protein
MSTDASVIEPIEAPFGVGTATATVPVRPWRPVWKTVGQYAVLSVLAFVVIFPIYITVVNSLIRPELLGHKPPPFFPTHPVWDTYSRAWSNGHFGPSGSLLTAIFNGPRGYLLNSFIVTTIIVVGQLLTATLAAYAFAFLEFPFKRTLFVVFLATLMIPFEVTVITNLDTVVSWGLYNSYAGLAIPFLATGFGAFLLRQSFLQLPRDLKDAAALDGYGHLRFLTRVVVPLSRPALAALGVFAFLTAWNQYLWPFLVTKDDEFRTVQIGLKQLRNTNLDQVNVTFAGVVIAVVPLAILLLLFQKQLVRGLTAGAVKG